MTSPTGGYGHSHENDGPGLLRGSMTLKSYIMAAYNVKPYQVMGGPNLDRRRHLRHRGQTGYAGCRSCRQILRRPARPAEEANSHALQGLLADRFQLKLHRETKEMPAYALTVAKSGFKLKQSSETAMRNELPRQRNQRQIHGDLRGHDEFASHLARGRAARFGRDPSPRHILVRLGMCSRRSQDCGFWGPARAALAVYRPPGKTWP